MDFFPACRRPWIPIMHTRSSSPAPATGGPPFHMFDKVRYWEIIGERLSASGL